MKEVHGSGWIAAEELGAMLLAFDAFGNRGNYEYSIRFRGKHVKNLGKIDEETALREWKAYVKEIKSCTTPG